MEKLRRGVEGFNRGDLGPVRSILAENVDWGALGAFPGLEDAYKGPRALDRWMEDVRSAWDVFEVSIDEVVRATDELVIQSERLWGRGKESGVEVTMTIHAVYWFARGKVIRRRVFESRREALAAAGQPSG